ncbi:FtsK/SpoIIIE domain-containing protein [Alicyclobacillus fastidiosus]|uniref:FtsK/SpoIIIE domain-containing protein n=1 Tax=Alicyclobacillus fastidiosus TaxID=392011 RepID=A0ABV5AKE0_9BACL|nr:FtsK/SpoIIIE domain-containing protein [Alicyclobacillus fastidiosus]WEH10996.1 FtsK/SpoIIIE domain-containing protein [Alicyclobacillus fastidiosus]
MAVMTPKERSDRAHVVTQGIAGIVVCMGARALVMGGTKTVFTSALLGVGTALAGAPLVPICFGIGAAVIWVNWQKDRVAKEYKVTEADVQGWRVLLGVTTWGRKVYHDFDAIPHTKIGGVTGSGKTKAIELILGQVIREKTAHEVEIHIIDMKGGASFSHFRDLPQVAGRVYAGVEEALKALKEIHEDMNARLAVVREERARFKPITKFKRILLVVDEGGELSPAYAHNDEDEALRKSCLAHLKAIASIGREPRVSIVYGTQRPSNETLPTSIRGQMDATMAYRTQDELDSNILLRNEYAAHLKNIKGRMIYQTPDGEREVQTGYIPDDVLQEWIEEQSLPEGFWNVPPGDVRISDEDENVTARNDGDGAVVKQIDVPRDLEW